MAVPNRVARVPGDRSGSLPRVLRPVRSPSWAHRARKGGAIMGAAVGAGGLPLYIDSYFYDAMGGRQANFPVGHVAKEALMQAGYHVEPASLL